MKFLRLVWAGLRGRPLRSILTTLAVAVAFLLFGIMHGVVSSFDAVTDQMSDVRLRVMSRANILETLPVSYRERILRIDGVTDAVPVGIFIGYYQQPLNQVTGAGMDIDALLRVMPEIKVPDDQFEVLRRTRTGAVVGALLAERYGWQLGDKVPLKSMMWMNADTGEDWTFDVVAIANGGPDDDKSRGQELWFHYDYLDEARAAGKGRVNQFVLGIEDREQSSAIAQAVDEMFANSADETSTLNEKQYIEQNLRQVGNVEAFVYYILSAVLFTLLFMTAINMVQAIRERTTELGIMRALGFSGDALGVMVVLESLVICVVGALLGLALAAQVFPGVFASFGIDGISLDGKVWVQGLGLAVVLALIAGGWPAWRAASLNVVEAIARVRR